MTISNKVKPARCLRPGNEVWIFMIEFTGAAARDSLAGKSMPREPKVVGKIRGRPAAGAAPGQSMREKLQEPHWFRIFLLADGREPANLPSAGGRRWQRCHRHPIPALFP
jgi:hypothetical protein